MASNTDIKIITGIKLKYLSVKINGYGSNRMFQVLDESTLKVLIELGKDLKNQFGNIRNGKYYLKINAVKIKEVQVENGFKRMFLILWIYHLVNTISKRNGEQITNYSIFEINKNY